MEIRGKLKIKHRKLYRLTFSDGRTYVGITKRYISERLWCHRKDSIEGGSKLYVAWRALGEPSVEVLAVVAEHMWVETERRAIATLKPELNTDPGGTGAGRKLSAERIAKRAATVTGRPLSAEHRAKLSAVRIGMRFSDEHRANLSAAKKAYLAVKRKAAP